MAIKPSLRFKGTPRTEAGRKKLMSLARELKNKGTEVLTIGAGDPVQFGFINQFLSNALILAAQKGLHMYAYATTFQIDLKHAIAEFEKKYRNVDYSAEDVILTPGVGGAWQVIHYTLLDAGDEMMAFEPSYYFTGPASHLHVFQSKVTPCRTVETTDWKPDFGVRSKQRGDRRRARFRGTDTQKVWLETRELRRFPIRDFRTCHTNLFTLATEPPAREVPTLAGTVFTGDSC